MGGTRGTLVKSEIAGFEKFLPKTRTTNKRGLHGGDDIGFFEQNLHEIVYDDRLFVWFFGREGQDLPVVEICIVSGSNFVGTPFTFT